MRSPGRSSCPLLIGGQTVSPSNRLRSSSDKTENNSINITVISLGLSDSVTSKCPVVQCKIIKNFKIMIQCSDASLV